MPKTSKRVSRRRVSRKRVSTRKRQSHRKKQYTVRGEKSKSIFYFLKDRESRIGPKRPSIWTGPADYGTLTGPLGAHPTKIRSPMHPLPANITAANSLEFDIKLVNCTPIDNRSKAHKNLLETRRNRIFSPRGAVRPALESTLPPANTDSTRYMDPNRVIDLWGPDIIH